MSLIDSEAGIGEESNVSDVLGAELGWCEQQTAREIEQHREAIEHERGMSLHPQHMAPAGAG